MHYFELPNVFGTYIQMDEVWKDIEGYEGLYQVSSLGKVRSLPRNTTSGKILKPITHKNGYLFVVLCKDGKAKLYKVHRLVALAFVPNDDPQYKIEVNHINEKKNDNRVSNLEWCTKSYNINYGSRNEKCSLKKSKPVKQLSLDGTLITIWPSMAEAGRNGFNQCNIVSCCNGVQKTHKGYKWEYLN